MDRVSELKERLRDYPGAHEGESWKLEKDLTKCTDKEKQMMVFLGVTPEELMEAGLNRGEVHHILFGCSYYKRYTVAFPKDVKFFLPMIPPTVTQQEHKVMVNRKTGRVQFYDPPELRAARAKLTDLVGRYAPEQPLEGALQLVTKWIWPMETDGQLALSGMEYRWKTSKPDTDNLIKMLKDCMTRTGYWKDDAQVVSEITQKFYGPRSGIYIEVVRMD